MCRRNLHHYSMESGSRLHSESAFCGLCHLVLVAPPPDASPFPLLHLLLIAASFTEGAEDKKNITRLAAALTFSNVQRIWSADLAVSPPGH
ncbi:hypothetical protein C8J57DRAFT_1714341 [Mycena rebaudengoi]|nr:hypothetical protein C8J57DRAFT_1714341 [Mycena rebaudengoi]